MATSSSGICCQSNTKSCKLAPLFSKSAHSNAITQVEYLNIIYKGKPTNVIVSIAKDGFLKVWDAETRLCISVISTQTTEAVSMAYNQ